MAKKKIHRNRIDTLSQACHKNKKKEKENALIFFLDASKLVHVINFHKILVRVLVKSNYIFL